MKPMTDKDLINKWTKICVEKAHTPICLITIAADGRPCVSTQYDKEIVHRLFNVLLKFDNPTENIYLNGQEN